jgi:O-antigen/teichoic acid export membrane protein
VNAAGFSSALRLVFEKNGMMFKNKIRAMRSDAGSNGWRASLHGRWARNRWLLADQALVSGMNFLTTAMLARVLGIHNFGIFSVFYIALQYLNSIQLALIVGAMMTLAPQIQDAEEQQSFLRGMAGYQYAFSLVCGVATALVAVLEALHLIPWQTPTDIFLPFILTILCFQAQDWFRRYCYARNRSFTVFWNDLISYLGQVTAFVVLWRFHRITVDTAYYAIAATSFLAFAIGLVREDIKPAWHEVKSSVRHTWAMGRSLLIASQSQWLGSQGILLIVAAIAGVSATAGIRAAMTLMGPVNVLLQLLENILPVRAAQVFAARGEQQLTAYLRRTTIVLLSVIGVPILLAAIFARPIMSMVFGKAYGAFAILVVWQGIYFWLGLICRQLMYYHRTVNNTAALARTAIIVATVSLAICLPLTWRYGATGGMLALDFGMLLNVLILRREMTISRRRIIQV